VCGRQIASQIDDEDKSRLVKLKLNPRKRSNVMMINSSASEVSRTGKLSRFIGSTIKRDFQVVSKSGLTMLMCTRLIEQIAGFEGRIIISNGAISVDGRSMIDMLQLAAVSGTVLTFEITGQDADRTMQRIESLMANPR
jgi:phosphotransferase system HPr (HPr) family protein